MKTIHESSHRKYNMSKALVIYHAQCRDGQAAAYIAVSALRRLGIEVSHTPCAYGGTIPSVVGFDRVYIVDFSFKQDVLIDMCKNVDQVTVLDHHKTAQADLENWADAPTNLKVVFDMTRCGARITYDFFDAGVHLNVPLTLIDYIQDRDLWTWKLDGSKQVSAWISTFGDGLESFAAMIDEYNDLGLHGVITTGGAVIGYQNQVIEKHLKSVKVYNLLGHKVAVTNATTMISEICNEALNQHPEADFALSWQDLVKEKKRVFSLRGRKGGVDVSEIAKKLGGGGHASAAGFTVAMPWLDIGAGY